MRDGLKQRCITRDLKWGIPVPLDGYRDKVGGGGGQCSAAHSIVHQCFATVQYTVHFNVKQHGMVQYGTPHLQYMSEAQKFEAGKSSRFNGFVHRLVPKSPSTRQ